MTTALSHVVELNECAKAVRQYAFEVSLSALGSIVRSSRAGVELRGFKEVASQMRNWSRDLDTVVKQVAQLATQRVHLVSERTRRLRLCGLLERAAENANAALYLAPSLREEAARSAKIGAALKQTDEQITEAFDAITQLGMMASVLSRSALIEAAGGADKERRDLTIASQEFATYGERVNAAISAARTFLGDKRP